MSTDDPADTLHGIEAVRRRPGMYIGDTRDGSGLEHMLWEVLANALDQHLARRARRVRVDIDASDWVTVEDDGAGFAAPTSSPDVARLERIFTVWRGSPTADGHTPHVHITQSLAGIGLMPVNAVCERMEVETCSGTTMWRAAFERGRLVESRRSDGAGEPGTRIRFLPDATIFSTTTMDLAHVEARLREIAWMSPLLEVRWRDRVLPWRGGIASWVRELAGDAGTSVIEHAGLIDEVHVDLALAWAGTGEPRVRSFVNFTEMIDGGTHVKGLRAALGSLGRSLGSTASPTATRRRLEPGLVAILHVGLFAPELGAPTRSHLVSPLARSATSRALGVAFAEALSREPGLAGLLQGRLQES